MGPAPHQLPDQSSVNQARRHDDHAAIEDAVILDETHDRPPIQAAPVDSAMVFNPALVRKGDRYELFVSREGARRWPWGFWGGITSLGAFVALVLRAGTAGFHDPKLLVAALTLIALGLGLLKWGPTDTTERARTMTIAPADRQLIWHQSGPDAGPNTVGVSMGFGEVSEIVFGMVFVPIDASHPDSRIHAFTLLVRDGRDQLIPVIAASPAKGELFELAKLLSHYTGAPITQVGKGIREG